MISQRHEQLVHYLSVFLNKRLDRSSCIQVFDTYLNEARGIGSKPDLITFSTNRKEREICIYEVKTAGISDEIKTDKWRWPYMHSDRFYFVVDQDVYVDMTTLPSGVGLLRFDEKSTSFKLVRRSVKNKHRIPLDDYGWTSCLISLFNNYKPDGLLKYERSIQIIRNQEKEQYHLLDEELNKRAIELDEREMQVSFKEWEVDKKVAYANVFECFRKGET